MSAVEIVELCRLQSLCEQKARSIAAAAQRTRREREQAARDAGEVLERALAYDAQCRAAPRFCIDRIALAAQTAVQAISHAAQCSDDAEAARVEHRRQLAAWQDAADREWHLELRAEKMRRAEDRKASDRRDLAAIVERNAAGRIGT